MFKNNVNDAQSKAPHPDPSRSREQLVAFFGAYIPLKRSEKEAIGEKFTQKTIKRRQFILQPGDLCKHYTFVVSGCFRLYGVSVDGVEHNLQFAAENDWIADIGSFHRDYESQLYLEALEPSVILQVTKPDLIQLYHHYPKIDRILRVVIEDKFVELQTRVLQNIGSTTEERYLGFQAQYPALSNRLSGIQIASYLGITPEFLSKLRKNLVKK
ncbi:Crp/Fnr family transcriptional regulator [Mucilaginibacter gynuensis]|uniref:Crp/Fnr family transcriptional regulator n=1 Tax=Mucilaginibacter gynuensis TaxID=1302236 RepID=A0ABP8GMX5_9SPHI